MNDFLKKLEPADVIAVILIGGVLVLNWRGITTMLSSAVLVVVGYYFAKRADRHKQGDKGDRGPRGRTGKSK